MRSRSVDSLRFETAVLTASLAGLMPRLGDIDFSAIADLAPWIAVVDPDRDAYKLTFVSAGDGIAAFLGCDPTGLDYLEIVDPAIKGDAFDSAFLMLSRPCGLWQVTPALTVDGRAVEAEYTGYPAIDVARGRGVIVMLIRHGLKPLPRIAMVKHAEEYAWLELRNSPPLA